MIYHGRSGETPEYVRDYVEYFSEAFEVHTEPGRYPRLWPIVQAHDESHISPDEFALVLEYGLAGRSSGVMMFHHRQRRRGRRQDGRHEARLPAARRRRRLSRPYP